MAVMYLVVTDFITGLVSYPLFIAKEVNHLKTTGPHCYTEDLFCLSMAIFASSSFIHLVLVAYERHVAINHSFYYNSRITVRRLRIASTVVWILIVMYNGLYFTLVYLPHHKFSTVYTILDMQYYIALPVLLLVAVYWYGRIFYTLRKVRLRIQRRQRSNINSLEGRRENCRHLQHQRSVFTILIQSFAFLIPYTLCAVTFVFIVLEGSSVRTSTFFVTLSVSDTLLLLNSLINPVIFCLRTTELRKECRKALRSVGIEGSVVQAQEQIFEEIEMQELQAPVG